MKFRYHLPLILIISLISIFTFGKSLYSSDGYWRNSRDFEPVVLQGSNLNDFLDKSVFRIFAFSYNSSENSWRQIPLQIDEKDDSSHVWVPENLKNNVLNSNDEIVFMARDAGDKAPYPHIWISDENSKNYPRYEFTLNDSNNTNKKGWIYFYYSTTLTDTAQGYMNYTPAPAGTGADLITGLSYIEGHNSGALPNQWIIPEDAGGNGLNLLDRQKARAVAFSLFVLSENNLKLVNPYIEYKFGKIRLIRKANLLIDEFFGLIKYKFDVQVYYYPYSIDSKGTTGTISSDYGINYLRQSFDLNANAINMKFSNNFNSNIMIDGNEDNPDPTLLFSPDINWYMFTGDQGTILSMIKVNQIGDGMLYYHDATDHSTADNYEDTGDNLSYGDVGVSLIGESGMEGRFNMPFTTYFLSRNQDNELGSEFVENYERVLNTSSLKTNYSPPVIVQTSLPDTSGDKNSSISIPVRISDVTGQNIKSCQLTVQCDTGILDVTSISVNNTIAANWTNVTFIEKSDLIKIHMSGTTSLSGSGDLLWITFNIIGSINSISPLNLTSVIFNDGYPLSAVENGSLTVTEPPVQIVNVFIPDSTKMSQSNLLMPVIASSVTNMNVKSFSMTISFDKNVLKFNGINRINTLSESWNTPQVINFSTGGGFTVIANGTVPLSGEGTLLNFDFDVIGEDGTSSQLKFLVLRFNSGIPNSTFTNGSITVEGTVPVELVSFTANSSPEGTELNWTTASESNNYGFFIESKYSENSQWETLKFIPGHGTTTTPQTYTYIHKNPQSGNWYYRLKQQDFDGQAHYSQIVEFNAAIPDEFTLKQNYPNPFNSTTIISYNLPVGMHDVTLKIYDILGHQVRELIAHENQSGGHYQIHWNGQNDTGKTVSTGIYFYELNIGNKKLIQKMALIE